MKENRRKIIQYGILIVLGYLILNPIIPIGDYCGGLLTVLNFLFFGAVLVLSFLVFTILNIIRSYKTKQKFDFVPLIITLVVGISFYLIQDQEESKFWTERTLTGRISVESSPKSGELRLYKNGSFAVTLFDADYSCTFQGDYVLNNDQLNLERKELTELTDSVFATEYFINEKSKTLIPTDKNFGIITIRK